MSSIKLLEILSKLSQKPTFRSNRHHTEIAAVSHQSAMHIFQCNKVGLLHQIKRQLIQSEGIVIYINVSNL